MPVFQIVCPVSVAGMTEATIRQSMPEGPRATGQNRELEDVDALRPRTRHELE
jgi:hypothetical protein